MCLRIGITIQLVVNGVQTTHASQHLLSPFSVLPRGICHITAAINTLSLNGAESLSRVRFTIGK